MVIANGCEIFRVFRNGCGAVRCEGEERGRSGDDVRPFIEKARVCGLKLNCSIFGFVWEGFLKGIRRLARF